MNSHEVCEELSKHKNRYLKKGVSANKLNEIFAINEIIMNYTHSIDCPNDVNSSRIITRSFQENSSTLLMHYRSLREKYSY